MAKKTNKTDRVLSLLSNDQTPGEDTQETAKPTKTTISDTGNVSVINEKENNNEMENVIEASLKKEFENEEIKTISEKKKEEKTLKDSIIGEVVTSGDSAVKVKEIVTEDTHAFVSVMEYIVKLKLDEYMKDFSVCTCSRCKADVVALALTNLPSKYVVTDADKISPILNFYENKYLGQVAVELTKACIRVSELPHHSR